MVYKTFFPLGLKMTMTKRPRKKYLLVSPQEIGTLGYERVRGKDHFVFEYSHEWLKQHGGIVLSGDLMLPAPPHPLRLSASADDFPS